MFFNISEYDHRSGLQPGRILVNQRSRHSSLCAGHVSHVINRDAGDAELGPELPVLLSGQASVGHDELLVGLQREKCLLRQQDGQLHCYLRLGRVMNGLLVFIRNDKNSACEASYQIFSSIVDQY